MTHVGYFLRPAGLDDNLEGHLQFERQMELRQHAGFSISKEFWRVSLTTCSIRNKKPATEDGNSEDCYNITTENIQSYFSEINPNGSN
jgi:hypothetical protein